MVVVEAAVVMKMEEEVVGSKPKLAAALNASASVSLPKMMSLHNSKKE